MAMSISTSIPWQDCFSAQGGNFNMTFQCANLTVPLSYMNIQNKTTQIRVAKLHPNELQNSQGPMFISGISSLSYSSYFHAWLIFLGIYLMDL